MEESFQFNFFQPTASASTAEPDRQSSAAAGAGAGQQALAAEPLAAAEVSSNEAVKVIPSL